MNKCKATGFLSQICYWLEGNVREYGTKVNTQMVGQKTWILSLECTVMAFRWSDSWKRLVFIGMRLCRDFSPDLVLRIIFTGTMLQSFPSPLEGHESASVQDWYLGFVSTEKYSNPWNVSQIGNAVDRPHHGEVLQNLGPGSAWSCDVCSHYTRMLWRQLAYPFFYMSA